MISAAGNLRDDVWMGLELSAAARSPTAARVVARLPQQPELAGCRLRGEIDGPFCAHTRTLRARFRLQPHDAADPLLLTAHLVDPCFWSGELPFLYQASLELCRGDEVLARVTREFGIRPIHVAGPQIALASTPIVFRAVDPRALRAAPTLEAWRDTNTAMLTTAPDQELCAACSRSGVMLIADVRGRASAADDWIELTKYPAVMAVVLAGDSTAQPPRMTGGPLRACDSNFPGLVPRSVVDLWHADLDGIDPEAWRRYTPNRPGFLGRTIEPCASLDEARRECDRLQRDAASQGQFAGYLVRGPA